ncbi:4'-phosphopantetheinyl transferase superfamily protein [Bosea sp. CS1GBMeth4]|uniref:4'-phosphopantetheinyl transferase family protein n=1 Tax=Bosea sp. CS1GBMeth4 TaxID=1892849 RepID=UPI001648E759|nr:4'-phosphopantetheinyl transferase superfamily protein [Bosea sp. CS1GBMeth4]
MFWLSSADETAPALPAAWLIGTGEQPRNLPERSLLRQAVARRVLARQLGLPEHAVALAHEPAGRPLIAAPRGAGIWLSLATRAGLVAVGLAHGPVGVDVEQIVPGGEAALDLLHPQERRMLQSLPHAARPVRFAQLWSAKEAYVKALGTGFARAPESFRIVLDDAGGFTVRDPGRDGTATGQSRIIENGGHEGMAAAFVVIG